jgi:hypothetical protein
MQSLKNRVSLLIAFTFLSGSLWGQDPMDFYWSTFSSGYGLKQKDTGVELYQCALDTKEFTSYAFIPLSRQYPAPNTWISHGQFVYGFSKNQEFTRVARINWHTKQSTGASILHPEVSAIFDASAFFENMPNQGIILLSPTTRKAALLDFEDNTAHYLSIPPEVVLDSLASRRLWYSQINTDKTQSTYAYRGIDLMKTAYQVIGLVLILFLAGVGLFFIQKRTSFRLNQKELSNRFKKVPLSREMHYVLKELAQSKKVRNQTLLDFFKDPSLTEDAIIKKKNKVIGELHSAIYDCFQIQFFDKNKDPNDRRETIYTLNPSITIKVTEQ